MGRVVPWLASFAHADKQKRAVVIGDPSRCPINAGGNVHPSAGRLLTVLRTGCQSQSRRRNMTNRVAARLIWRTNATTKPLVAPKPGYGTFMP